MRLEKPQIWLLILVTTYVLGHALWYWQTPMGQFPVLDGLENLNLAKRIASGTLASEPFYRAMLYPALLAILPVHWMALGIICHLANTLLSMQLSNRIWDQPWAALITVVLVGFNPVLIHFALDPLDITLATTFLLLGLTFSIPVRGKSLPDIRSAATAGLFFTLAALTRPHFFAILIPALTIATAAGFFLGKQRATLAAFTVAAVVPIIAFGFVQKVHSGAFRVLPTQGSYSLWVSNNANANGLYYKQSLNFHYTSEHENPARLESERLFLKETGEAGTVDKRSDFWRSKTFDHITNDLSSWVQLTAFKIYAWVNNFEQYNNKTYSFHKNLSPYLRYNAIGWGLLLTLSSLALFLAINRGDRHALVTLLAILGLYSAGALLYMASARFRLPLVPLLAIFAGGVPVALASWKTASRRLRMGSVAATIGIATLAFSSGGSVASTETFQQDTMLLADASSRAGRDLDAFNWAEATLAFNPARQDAKRLRILSFYNLVATGQEGSTGKSWHDFREDLQRTTLRDPYIDFVKGIAHWSYHQPDAARKIWKDTFEKHAWDASSSLAALIYTDSPIDFSIPNYPAQQRQPNPLLTFALNRAGQDGLRDRIGFPFALSPDSVPSIAKSMNRVLPELPES